MGVTVNHWLGEFESHIRSQSITITSTCATTNRRKVDWDKINLIDLMSKHGISELEDMLGISNAAIYKRRNKILRERNLTIIQQSSIIETS